MSEAAEREEQDSFIGDDGPAAEPTEGPVALPPALVRSSVTRKRAGSRAHPHPEAAAAEQLPLPLDPDPELPTPDLEPRVAPPAGQKRRRKGHAGFVPVTRDPDVARSYSDNAALDNAVAEGLAHVLAALPPEELAALRAMVARRQPRGTRGN